MSPLIRTNEWRDLHRPLICHHCLEPVASGAVVIVDLENPWFSIHESCLQDLGVDQLVQLYDEIGHLRESYNQLAIPGSNAPLPVSKTNEVERRLEDLERQIGNLREMYVKKLVELPRSMRPGVRRQPPQGGH